MKHRVYFKVQLLDCVKNLHNPSEPPIVIMTTDVLLTMYDAHEFVHWLSCQLSTPFYYQILEFCEEDNVRYVNAFPALEKAPTPCKYWPPEPLYLHIKKKRRQERNHLGLYYEYD